MFINQSELSYLVKIKLLSELPISSEWSLGFCIEINQLALEIKQPSIKLCGNSIELK
jgi:hypothetical protein